MRILILCLLFLLPTALAEDKGIFYILDEKFIDNISDLPYSAGVPDKNIQTSGNIQAWIDIVGFDKIMRENGQDYLPGDPLEYAIIQYDAIGTQSGVLDDIEKSVSRQQSGNSVLATLRVKLLWHEVLCDNWGCWSVPHLEEATFQDTEVAPQIYPRIENFSANITQYNNSLYENIGIRIVNISGLNKYTVQYEDNTAICRLKQAHVEQTAKGIYFVNVTPVLCIERKEHRQVWKDHFIERESIKNGSW